MPACFMYTCALSSDRNIAAPNGKDFSTAANRRPLVPVLGRKRLLCSAGRRDPLLHCDSASQRDRPFAYGAWLSACHYGCLDPLSPNAGTSGAVAGRHRPCRYRNTDGSRTPAGQCRYQSTCGGARGIRQQGLGLERRIRRDYYPAAQTYGFFAGLVQRAFHHGPAALTGRGESLHRSL